MRFFTSDLHIGHRNIIEYSGRPFLTVDEMNWTLVYNWNNLVGDSDEVVVLGDFALGKTSDLALWTPRFNGKKILLAGNHDRCWEGHSKGVERETRRYLDAGFSEVWQGVKQIDLLGREVLICHFPYTGDSREKERYADYRPYDTGQWLLHGHVHEKWRQRQRMVNVGVDVWDYRPVSEDMLTWHIDALERAKRSARPFP